MGQPYHKITTWAKKPIENIVRKGENHHCKYLNLTSANAFSLDQSKILLFGNELTILDHTRYLCTVSHRFI